MTFTHRLLQELLQNSTNDHKDNVDWGRQGLNPVNSQTLRSLITYPIRLLARKLKYISAKGLLLEIDMKAKDVQCFEFLYNNLLDQASRDLLIKVLCYRILGYRKVKLPLNTPEYWSALQKIEASALPDEPIETGFLHFVLKKHSLIDLGHNLTIFARANAVLTEFVVKQYEFNNGETNIKVEKDDYVIDGGGCWGETALMFASLTGSGGKVYSFEFIPKNLKIFNTNLDLNPAEKKTITLIENPLWKFGGLKLYCTDRGPASTVSTDPTQKHDLVVSTLSIDELVQNGKIEKVDFLKLDIEGAELNTLMGAVETIKKFKPKLAIALYHSAEDFDTIPRFIHSLGLGYKFYFSHATIHREESMLFASVHS